MGSKVLLLNDSKEYQNVTPVEEGFETPVSGWQPIATAPLRGQVVELLKVGDGGELLWISDAQYSRKVGKWLPVEREGCSDDFLDNPTHWKYPTLPPEKPAPQEWGEPISTAPKDGALIQAKIPGNGSDNILVWTGGLLDDNENECSTWVFAHDEQEPPDCWTDGVCWEVNEDGKPSVKPTRWKPCRAEGE